MEREHPDVPGRVIQSGRVMGVLAPTRAFGDAAYKDVLSSTPDVVEVPMNIIENEQELRAVGLVTMTDGGEF